MERKNRMMMGVSEETQSKLLKEVVVLEEKLTDMEGELFGANAEKRRLKAQNILASCKRTCFGSKKDCTVQRDFCNVNTSNDGTLIATCSCTSARDLLLRSFCFLATFCAPGTLEKQPATQKTKHERYMIAVAPKEYIKRHFSAKSCVLLILTFFSFWKPLQIGLPRDA